MRNVSFQMRTRTKGETYINICQNIYMEELIHCAHTAPNRWMIQRKKMMMISIVNATVEHMGIFSLYFRH